MLDGFSSNLGKGVLGGGLWWSAASAWGALEQKMCQQEMQHEEQKARGAGRFAGS
jgi:hypothetical protein